jgi:hypothetical protein
MGYNKIITYGNTIEIYEYEKDIYKLASRARRDYEIDDVHVDVGDGGEDTLSRQENKAKMGRRADNARRAAMAFRRIVSANLCGGANPLLVTLTYKDNFTDLAGAYRHLTAFNQALRYRYGKTFAYILVPEFQKRGAVHFHALFWGLPEELFYSERETRILSEIWGHGFVFLKQTDGHEKLAFYLAKYFTKAYLDPRLKNQKSYVASRNVKRPIVQKGPFIISVVLDEFGIIEEALVDRTYNTKWLGEGRYRLFNLLDAKS